MIAASGVASLATGAMVVAAVPGGIVVVGGAAVVVTAGIGINHLFTKLEIAGNTIEGHLNNLVDWLTFWE